MTDTLPLASSLDTAAAAPLLQELRARLAGGQPLLLDGAAVSRAGQACLQVLASARAAAGEAGLPFAITAPSEALAEMIGLARLDTLLAPLG